MLLKLLQPQNTQRTDLLFCLDRQAQHGEATQGLPPREKQDMYLAWYREVVKRTAQLVAAWQGVGFIHGMATTLRIRSPDVGSCCDAGLEYWRDARAIIYTDYPMHVHNRLATNSQFVLLISL